MNTIASNPTSITPPVPRKASAELMDAYAALAGCQIEISTHIEERMCAYQEGEPLAYLRELSAKVAVLVGKVAQAEQKLVALLEQER